MPSVSTALQCLWCPVVLLTCFDTCANGMVFTAFKTVARCWVTSRVLLQNVCELWWSTSAKWDVAEHCAPLDIHSQSRGLMVIIFVTQCSTQWATDSVDTLPWNMGEVWLFFFLSLSFVVHLYLIKYLVVTAGLQRRLFQNCKWYCDYLSVIQSLTTIFLFICSKSITLLSLSTMKGLFSDSTDR